MSKGKTRLAVTPQDAGDSAACETARQLAEALRLPFVRQMTRSPHWDLRLLVSSAGPVGIHVCSDDPEHATIRGGHPVIWSFADLDIHSSAGRRGNQPLFKAMGPSLRVEDRPLRILDVTAGFGHDACLLASRGYELTLLERHPVAHALLAHALDALRTSQPELAGRMRLLHVDACDHLTTLTPEQAPDVIYIDPMFPSMRRSTERKAMRVLRLLAGDDPDAPSLLEIAMSKARRRVVVKRPLRAPVVEAAVAPEISHKGQAVRYDVYPVA